MFDKRLDEIILNMVNQAQNWLISQNKKEIVIDHWSIWWKKVHIFVDNEYYKYDTNGKKVFKN